MVISVSQKERKMEPIRVLQVIGIMNRGGAETMIMNLYRNIDRNKVQFDFVENSFEKAVFDDEIEALGGKIYHCPHFTEKNLMEYKKWWRDFYSQHKEEYRIVHGHIGSTAAIYLKEAKKNGIFTIAHSHSIKNHSVNGILYNLLSYPTRFIADYFFACSKVAGIDRYGKKFLERNRSKVLPNAIDTKKYVYNLATRGKVRQAFVDDNEILVGHIGRFVNAKNHKFLISIFEEFLKIVPNSKLLLVGDGNLRKEVEQLVKQKGINDHVIFTGVRTDINEIVQAMDIFVFPSLYEGLPVTLVETQTSGLPCVISDKVPDESIITKKLVTVKKLTDAPKEWAKHMSDRLTEKRYDRTREVIDAGFDISETAKWLEEFYLEKYRKN